jgi:hypothetical protein
VELHPAAAALVAVAAVLTAGATVWRFGLGPVVRLGLDLRELLLDLKGTPSRPGHPAVPGVLDQVAVNTVKLDDISSKLEEHLTWSRITAEHMDRVVEEHLVESERTRQAGHTEATHLWDAIGEIARHGGLTIERPPGVKTRRDDRPEEKP